jgi:hypothetical protein
MNRFSFAFASFALQLAFFLRSFEVKNKSRADPGYKRLKIVKTV